MLSSGLISDLLKELLLAQPASPLLLSPSSHHSNFTESFMYLSSREPTRSEILLHPEDDDPSLDQIHFLLQKAQQFKMRKNSAQFEHEAPAAAPKTLSTNPTDPIKMKMTSEQLLTSTPMPLPNSYRFNFKPSLHLLERSHLNRGSVVNSPLSQSTPMVLPPLLRPTVEPQRKKKSPLATALAREMEAVSDDENDKSYSKSIEKIASQSAYISPEPTPPTSNGHLVGADERGRSQGSSRGASVVSSATGNAEVELKQLKLYLAQSESGKLLLQGFESGLPVEEVAVNGVQGAAQGANQAPAPVESTDSTQFSRSVTSTPNKNQRGDISSHSSRLNAELKFQDEINDLMVKLQDAHDMIGDLQKETQAHRAEIDDKNIQISHYENAMNNYESFMQSVIGDESESIDREFLNANECGSLYDKLDLLLIDNLTFVELQNSLKELCISLQTSYDQLPTILWTMSKFFRDDYLRLILFIRQVHGAVYRDSKLMLPEVYKLGWIEGEQMSEHDLEKEDKVVEQFDRCLKEMARKVRTMTRRTRQFI